MLTVAGLQVPVIPLVEVVGKIGATLPWHITGKGPKLATVALLRLSFNT